MITSENKQKITFVLATKGNLSLEKGDTSF
jgi:hypothetical protein